MFQKYNNQKGQVLLIIVLVMIIALTVGLSLISRSITNLKTSNEEVNSQKALSAAEAGIEQVIKNNTCPPDCTFGSPFENNSNFSGTIEKISGTSILVNGGDTIAKNDGVDIWLSDYSNDATKIYNNPTSGNLVLHWGNSSTACDNAAIEVIVVSETIASDKTSAKTTKYAYDPCRGNDSSGNRAQTNSFTAPAAGSGGTVQGVSFAYKTPSIPITNGLFVRIIPLYSNTQIGADGLTFPLQGTKIVSNGTSGTSKRTVSVFQGFPKIPAELFPYSLFSP